MINPGSKILKAWFELLSGNVSYQGNDIPVYRTDAPSTETGHYIVLRIESSNDGRNNQENVYRPVVITEVVTVYDAMINDDDVYQIDSIIASLLSTEAATHNLPVQEGIQVVSIQRVNQTTFPEDDGTRRYNRLVTRNVHRVVESEPQTFLLVDSDGTFIIDFDSTFIEYGQ